jgi:hypothetical protein
MGIGGVGLGVGSPATAQDIRTAVAWLVRFQHQTTDAIKALAAFSNEFDTMAGACAKAGAEPGPVRAFLNEISAVIAGGTGVNIKLVCSHGDFFPGNVLVDGGRVRVIDWETMREGAIQTDDLFSLFLSYRLPPSQADGADRILDSFRFVFMEDSWFSRMVVEAIRHYAVQTGLAGGRSLEALFVFYLLRQSVLEAQGVMEQKMMARERWQARLEYYAAHRGASVLRAL